jgi:magnesium transporter
VRKVITPVSGVTELPGMTREIERYFRDLYDHLIRISDLVDSYRDLLTGSMDAYLSTVSNRLKVVMKQLTVIATIFLPLSFLTGFFGQNFAWMSQRIGGLPAFLVIGLGAELAVVAAMLVLFRRRGWL